MQIISIQWKSQIKWLLGSSIKIFQFSPNQFYLPCRFYRYFLAQCCWEALVKWFLCFQRWLYSATSITDSQLTFLKQDSIVLRPRCMVLLAGIRGLQWLKIKIYLSLYNGFVRKRLLSSDHRWQSSSAPYAEFPCHARAIFNQWLKGHRAFFAKSNLWCSVEQTASSGPSSLTLHPQS